MVKNHNLAHSIQTQSWDSLFTKLKYKAEMYDRTLIKIDRFFPSSKLCHKCGYKNEDLTLKTREWQCPECGIVHNRNVNAAINICREGLKIYKREINQGVLGLACATMNQQIYLSKKHKKLNIIQKRKFLYLNYDIKL